MARESIVSEYRIDFHEFPNEEYDLRWGRARKLMAEQELDGLMVTGDFCSAMNYRYFTGHLPRDYQQNHSRPHVFLLPREGAPVLIVVSLSAGDAPKCTWIDDIRVYHEPLALEIVRQAVVDVGLADGCIGAELGLDQRLMMPYLTFEALRESLPRASFVDASSLLLTMRAVKSPREVERIKEAARIYSGAIETCFRTIEEGMTEEEVSQRLVHLIVDGGAFRPPLYQNIIATTGGDWSLHFLPPTKKTLRRGDVIFMDAGCVYRGYWNEYNRMGVVGPPDERALENHRIVREVVDRTVAAMKPGAPISQVLQETVAAYRDQGVPFEKYSRYAESPYAHIGHGVGLNGSERPFLRMDNDEPLEAGMYFSVEAYLSDHERFGDEQTVIITERGSEIISTASRELYTVKTRGD
ncbi:MAG: M24 family metallopeptidase [Nitrospinota bacterium]